MRDLGDEQQTTILYYYRSLNIQGPFHSRVAGLCI